MNSIGRTPGISPNTPSPKQPHGEKIPSKELKAHAEKIQLTKQKHQPENQIPKPEKKHTYQLIPSNSTIASKVKIASHRAL